ncbi:MAG: hypothetical protein ABIH00_07790 [Armatimonadota bacterium]
MKTGKILLAGFIMWIVSTVVGIVTCGHLFNWVYKIPPVIWKDPAMMMNTTNMALMNLVGLISSIIFALVYAVFYKGIPGQGAVKGMTYGFFIWMVSALIGVGSMPFYMTIATTVVIYWILQALFVNLVNGAILGFIYKE